MMINKLKIIVFLFSFLQIISCEKEIEIDVKDSEPKIVVEAQLSDKKYDAVVKLSQSLPLNSESDYKKISGAKVSIIRQKTNEQYILPEVEPGIYRNDSIKGLEGETYNLEIILEDGSIITSTDTMPSLVELEDVSLTKESKSFGDDEDDDDEEFYKVTPVFDDPADVENFYQLILLREDETLDEINIFSDLGFDGLPNSSSIYIDVYPGDNLKVFLLNISEPVYEYLRGLDAILQQGSATPTNPISNIKGENALGYFKVYSSGKQLELVIPND